MIEARGLTKRYRDHTAIEDVSFVVGAGEVVGLLGPNGAGKTTTMRILTGALQPTQGTARIDGHDVFEAAMLVKGRVGYVPEYPPLYPDLTVGEFLTFVASLKGVPRRRRAEQVDTVAGRVGVDNSLRRLIRNLSKGYRQRVGLAQALLGNPKVLVLDEPTAGLDPRQIGEVRSLVRELAGSHTVILSTHILQEVTAICDRVIIISRGRIVADDPIDKLVARHGSGAHSTLEQVFLSLTEM